MSLNDLRASRKADRIKIAEAIQAAAAEFGATVERNDHVGDKYRSREITLHISLNGVGAVIHIEDLFDGGAWSLIHWHNAYSPDRRTVRNFGTGFNVVTGSLGSRWGDRGHHKATSHPRDWVGLIAELKAGLAMAADGTAFEEDNHADAIAA